MVRSLSLDPDQTRQAWKVAAATAESIAASNSGGVRLSR